MANISGTPGNDFLNGTIDTDTIFGDAGNDVIVGNAGDDLIFGQAGDDNVNGNEGNDQVFGGDGNDVADGGQGNDLVSGEAGNDVVSGGSGDDVVFGNAGNDEVNGNAGNDLVRGGADGDTVRGGQGDDVVFGDLGNDLVLGDNDNDVLYGNQGVDTIDGGFGNDVIFGGQDSDFLDGSEGSDLVQGDGGNDVLIASAGRDVLVGGEGNDQFIINLASGGSIFDADVIQDFSVGSNRIGLSGGLTFADLVFLPGIAVPGVLASDTVIRHRPTGLDLVVIQDIANRPLTENDFILVPVTGPNLPPALVSPIPDQDAIEDESFSFTFTADTFQDPQGEPLAFAAVQADNSPLPGWLNFDPAARTFSGTPGNEDTGTVTVKLVAGDGQPGGFAEDEFDIVVSGINDPPVVVSPIPDQAVNANFPITFGVGGFFQDPDGDTLTLTTNTLPSWLTFANGVFTGTPTNANVGTTSVEVIARDPSGESVTDNFNITIQRDARPQVVTIQAIDPFATEGSATETAVFRVGRSIDISESLTVNFIVDTANTTAGAGEFSLSSFGSVTVPAGQAFVDVILTANEDNADVVPEVVQLTLAPSTESNYQISTPNTAAVIILDNDPNVSIQAVAPTKQVQESGSTAFAITRTGPITDPLTVSYTVNPTSTATPATDFSLSPASSITIPAGSASANIVLTALDDVVKEADETVGITLSPSASYTINASQSSDTIAITDNDIPTVSIAAALAAINEGTGTTNFTITRTDTAGDLIVQFGVVTGTTTAASTDYNLSASSFVTIPNGATSTSFTLTAGQDSPEDTFNDILAIALLPSGIDYRVDTTSGTAQVEIIDNDASTFSVTAAPASLVENSGGTATFTVTRIGNTTNAATVNFTTSGDATLNTDYTLSSGGSVTFNPGITSQNIILTPTNDTTLEVTETATLTLTPSATYNINAASDEASVTIQDDDSPVLSITAVPTAIVEGTGVSTVTLSLTNLVGGTPFLAMTGGVTANFALDAATTAEPNDFALSVSGVPVTGTSVVIPEGQSSVSITLRALDDTAADTDNESLTLNLAAGTGYQVSTIANTQTINILDDEGSNAPTLTVPGPAPTYTENGAPLILDATATVFDPDSPNFDTGNLTASITAGGTASDRLAIRNEGTGAGQIGISGSDVTFGGVTIGTFTGGNPANTTPLVVTFNANATSAAAQALLRNITFQDISEAPSPANRTVRFTIADGDGETSVPVTKTVTVVPQEDNPIITNLGPNVTFTEGAVPLVLLDPALTVTDNDSANFDGGSLAVSLTANGSPDDVLSIRDQGVGANQISLVGSTINFGNPATPIGTFTGGTAGTALSIAFNANATPANVAVLMQNLLFSNPSSNPSTLTRIVQFQLADGDGGNKTEAKQIVVNAVNNNPVVTLAATPLAYTEDAGAVVIDTTTTVTDADSADFTGGNLTVSITAGGLPEDQLNIRNEGPGAGQIGVAGTDITFGGTIIGTVVSVGTTSLTVNLNASSTPAAAAALARNITYQNTSQNPNVTPRTVQFQVADGDGGTSVAATKTVNITSVNDAPAIDLDTMTPGSGFSATFAQGGGAVGIANPNPPGEVSTADLDNTTLSSATITITNLLDPGFETLDATTNPATITKNYNPATGVLTLTNAGAATFLDFNAAIRSVTYNNTDTAPDPTLRNVTFVVNDGAATNNLSAPATSAVTVVVGQTLTGDANANTLLGGAAADIIIGAGGNDNLTGGAGNDFFRYTATNQGIDTITDFTLGSDRISFNDGVGNVFRTTDFRFGDFDAFVEVVTAGAGGTDISAGDRDVVLWSDAGSSLANASDVDNALRMQNGAVTQGDRDTIVVYQNTSGQTVVAYDRTTSVSGAGDAFDIAILQSGGVPVPLASIRTQLASGVLSMFEVV